MLIDRRRLLSWAAVLTTAAALPANALVIERIDLSNLQDIGTDLVIENVALAQPSVDALLIQAMKFPSWEDGGHTISLADRAAPPSRAGELAAYALRKMGNTVITN